MELEEAEALVEVAVDQTYILTITKVLLAKQLLVMAVLMEIVEILEIVLVEKLQVEIVVTAHLLQVHLVEAAVEMAEGTPPIME